MEDWKSFTKLALSRWKDFHGRSRRAEYWWFYLSMVCFQMLAVILFDILRPITLIGGLAALAFILAMFAILIPSLAISFRRLHDLDKSAWWWLLALIPAVGTIILVVWTVQRGTVGPNRFGPDPLEGVAPSVDPLVN